jgi:hypothetical protein
MARLKLDLHDVYNDSKAIDQALREIFEEAIEKRNSRSGNYSRERKRAVKKKSRTFFTTTAYKTALPRIENDSKNFGRCLCISNSEF